MADSFLSKLLDYLSPRRLPGDGDDNCLEVKAVPGLMTLLDVALFEAVEGELTATLTTSHALLAAWLDLKQQAIKVLQELKYETEMSLRYTQMESFARACFDAACDEIERLSTDRLAQSANLSDPYEKSQVFSGQIQDSFQDTGRRRPQPQRPRDCWESPRLHCPDYCWADEAAQNSQRLLRLLWKHPVCDVDPISTTKRLSLTTERQASILLLLVQTDIPTRLLQFRTATEADSVVSKRLYLVKCEYRAPFRAFLEAHQSVLRAPSLELIQGYIGSRSSSKQKAAKEQLQQLLENRHLKESVALEQKCEEFEMEMAKALFPFCELSRNLEHKRARIPDGSFELQELMRRLKGLLCRKGGPETSTGIRPLLLDLQGVPRDDDEKTDNKLPLDEAGVMNRLEIFVGQLKTLSKLVETRNSFQADKRSDVDLPSSIVRGCSQFDHELFSCQFQDWYAMVKRQHELLEETSFYEMADKLRRAEMEMSLAVAPSESLKMVKQRVEMITSDREKKFEVLKETIQEVCLREMSLHVQVISPDQDKPLSLKATSALGIFGIPLTIAGETLPIG